MSDSSRVLGEWIERDLTRAAAQGELAPAFEVEDLLRRVSDLIGSGRHPVLSGDAGIGKTAVIHELVRRAQAGNGPAALLGRRVVQISFRTRLSALSKPEQLRPETQKLVSALLQHESELVPYLRDLHLVYVHDLEPQLETLAQRFRGAILGEADAATLDSLFEYRPDLEQYFLALRLSEPDLSVMERLLLQWSLDQTKRGRDYDTQALSSALALTHRFLARTRLPRKTLELLGQVGSVVGASRKIAEADVIDRFHQTYKVPRLLVDPAISFDPVATEKLFCSRVLEQQEAVETVVRMIALIKTGLSDTRRPFGAFLFVGPTGVGKTHIAQLLAEYLFGSRERLVRLNMADYPEPHDAQTLFGNPDASPLYLRRGVITTRLMGHPFAVLLLDEFEKAHPKVHDRFLQLMDEGIFINGTGEAMSCRSAIIIATSNAGAEVYRGPSLGFSSVFDPAHERDFLVLDRALDRELNRHFRTELLNRFDQVVHFHPLSRRGIRTIALREIEQLRERAGLRARGIALEVDEGVLDWLTSHGYDPNHGARFLRRTIERHVTTAIADTLVQETAATATRVELGVRGGMIIARAVDGRPRTEPKTEAVRLPHGTSERVRVFDRKALLDEAYTLLESAEPHLFQLESRRDEASRLLEQMNKSGFWDARDEAQAVLEAFRRHDVALRVESRLAHPLHRLADLLADNSERGPDVQALARMLEAASAALRQWEERRAEEGPGAVWLLIRNLDPLHDAEEWIEQLVEMELAWCRRLQLVAEVVAYGLSDERLARVALEVEGPGALTYLTMEHGVHRLHRGDRSDLRGRIDVVVKSAKSEPSSRARVWEIRRRPGRFGLELSVAGRIEEAETGLLLELFAVQGGALSHLLGDLVKARISEHHGLEIARYYAHSGAGARDPRTGVVIPRFRDVIAGRLDAMLEGWRRAGRTQAPVLETQ